MKFIQPLAFSALLAFSAVAFAATNSQYDSALKATKAAQKKAASIGGEWRDTGKLMKAAAKAHKAKDLDKAMKLLAQAKHQSEMGYKQAKSQMGKDITPFYLK